MTPEGKIEHYLKTKCKKQGFLCYKFTAPSNAGVPDRIVIGNGKTIFVELKAPGEKPRPLQLAVHKLMKQRGALVYVIDNKKGVDDFIKDVLL